MADTSHPKENWRHRKRRRLHPYVDSGALLRADGRTKEARLLFSIREELVEHVGGEPNAVQRALIEQAAQLRLRIALMDRKFAETGVQTELDSRTYLAWTNSYARLLARLGPASPPRQASPSLRDYLARKKPAAGAVPDVPVAT